MDKFLIIDGQNLLFKMFFGIPNKILNKNNVVVNGVLGFCGALFKLIKNINPKYALVVFDSEQELLRKNDYDSYKQNRTSFVDVAENDNPFSQLDFIEKMLMHVGVKFMCATNGYEADDYIAEVVKQNKNIMHYIVSDDSDFLQLVKENVNVVKYKGDNSVVYDNNMVFTQYRINPSLLVLYKALVGDSSDNIKGVNKIGKITAKKILEKHNSLNEIYNNLNEFNLSIKENLINQKNDFIKNISLIQLIGVPDFEMVLNEYLINHEYFLSTTSREVLRELDIF